MLLTGLTGLSGLAADLPARAVVTDDPMRAKMLAAHWLDSAEVIYDLRGMIGYTGSYKGAPISLIAAGYGESAAMLYLHDARMLGVKRVIYMGECISRIREIKLRDVILADGGDAALTLCAQTAAKQLPIVATVRGVVTNDRLFLDEIIAQADIVDFASGAAVRYAAGHGLAVLSVLTVSQNTVTGEKMEEHERQSRFNAASQLVFETLAMDAQTQ